MTMDKKENLNQLYSLKVDKKTRHLADPAFHKRSIFFPAWPMGCFI